MSIETAIKEHFKDRKKRWGLNAFTQGFIAAQNGQPIEDCPYSDRRTTDGKVTFARGYINAWRSGYIAYWRGFKPGDQYP